ncbi:MAG: serine/threonine protein kinase [Gemmatimonadota bacterium]|nr:MAG: serine/threonine protein kinase [Gemmatimonadota bacterium]
MSPEQLIGMTSGDVPAHPTGELPPDLLEAASRRLGVAALVWAGLWGLSFFLNNVVSPVLSPETPLDDAWPWPGNPVALGVIALSLALFAYTRWHACDCRRSLDLGLGYEVVLAFAIGFVNQWTPNAQGLSWICVLVLVHPMIVPHTWGKTLAAALVAASMDPLGLAITSARGVPVPSAAVILWTYLPNYLCALLSVVPARIITRLGRQVSDARELGAYQLGERLGSGGMGDVYGARHRMLRRPAAVKVIRRGGLGDRGGESAETLVRRFKREAEATASLHSPHTVAVYDFGVTREGDLYYVMELLRGLDLETLVDRFGPLPPPRVVHLLRQACHSLAEAHGAGLIHRDVKPGNLYSCWFGLDADFLKVTDFGLVKSSPDLAAEQTKLTAPGLTTGTPAFMAPELAMNDHPDWRVDIYALGCVAYWLLTGRLVFEADTPMRMMIRHIEGTPVPPSSVSEFDIPAELDDLVLACLAKDRRARPSDAVRLARMLADLDVGEPWLQERAAQWWRANVPEIVPFVEAPVPPAPTAG